MRTGIILSFLLSGSLLFTGCVDELELSQPNRIDVVVVDGIINNLPESQIIRLNRFRTDSLTGRFGYLPITKALVELVVDSAQIVTCHETEEGSYQPPSDFRGLVGHAYQLRFTLRDGTQYTSTQQVMPAVPPLDNVVLRFNATSLPLGLLEGSFRAGFDMLIDTQDPAAQQNYYRWDWSLYEKQDYCRSCNQGYYMTNQLKLVSSYPNILAYQTQPQLYEGCFGAPSSALFGGVSEKLPLFFVNSYGCRTQCWDILSNPTINTFSDSYSNGGLITSRNVGQVPYYTRNPALVEVRQSSLTADAYRYFRLFQQQTQNTGGLADTPPTALVGNVRNVTREQEKVIGYFTASAVSTKRHWLDKKDAVGFSYGGVYYDPATKSVVPVPGEQQLFYAFNQELPKAESYLNFTILGGGRRPPTALCVPSDSRTPFKPNGWRD